jgi:hypothetical protein
VIEEEEINESGTGIAFPGYKKPIEIDEEFKYPPKITHRVVKDKELHYIQPSSDEIAERLKSRDLLENKALDWFVCFFKYYLFYHDSCLFNLGLNKS